ncbi:MAG: hypothetical protein NTV68_04320 [Methanomicrobiales archaeon]|nr:hypothetical protein [Methanomicrobiales archaeon]
MRFDLRDRVILIPVELRSAALYAVVATITLWFVGGWLPAAGFLAAVLAGTVLFPVLLPYLPTDDFSTKGLFLGIIIAAPFATYAFLTMGLGTPPGCPCYSNCNTHYSASNHRLSCTEFYRVYSLHIQDRG